MRIVSKAMRQAVRRAISHGWLIRLASHNTVVLVAGRRFKGRAKAIVVNARGIVTLA